MIEDSDIIMQALCVRRRISGGYLESWHEGNLAWPDSFIEHHRELFCRCNAEIARRIPNIRTDALQEAITEAFVAMLDLTQRIKTQSPKAAESDQDCPT